MSETEIVNFMSEENGFNANAKYYGSYLNQETKRLSWNGFEHFKC